MPDTLAFFAVFIIILNIRGFKINLNIKLNIKSIFKSDVDTEEFIELFNYRLLRIILHIENQGVVQSEAQGDTC